MVNKKPPESENRGKTPKYSLKTYLIAMLAVVLAVVVLSYFVQQRHSDRQIYSFSETHGDRAELMEGCLDALKADLEL
jgi:hypothetical protein